MNRTYLQSGRVDRDVEQTGASPHARRETSAILLLQQQAGNAAVSSLLAAGTKPVVSRWKNLGKEHWTTGFGTRDVTVWTGTKEEWSSRLDNIDDEDEYVEDVKGFLEVSNDPSLVGRTRPPTTIASDPNEVGFSNTITRAPTDAEKLAFLEALYEKAGDLDLWHGGAMEGGTFVWGADDELAKFIQQNQGLYLAHLSQQGTVISSSGVGAVAEQGGRQATLAMIINAGATAHTGVDLVMAANRMPAGTARESAKAQAGELIRNAGRTIKAALVAHDARVAFQQSIIDAVFDHVWATIPGGRQLVDAGKAILKLGFGEALKKASEDSGPSDQFDKIEAEFVSSCHQLVNAGLIDAADLNDAVNGFLAASR